MAREQCRFGFQVGENGQLVPVEEEQNVLRLIENCRSLGFSWKEIIEAVFGNFFQGANPMSVSNCEMSEDGNPIVRLERWEYEHAVDVGVRRMTANWNKQDAEYYQNKSILQEERVASPAIAVCELAVAKYLGLYWHGSYWHATEHSKYRDLPDVGEDVEVRRVRTGAATVRRKDRGRKVWVAREHDSEHRTVEILGFVEADEIIRSMVGDSSTVFLIDLERPWMSAAAS